MYIMQQDDWSRRRQSRKTQSGGKVSIVPQVAATFIRAFLEIEHCG
jgi:hypothetical protein